MTEKFKKKKNKNKPNHTDHAVETNNARQWKELL